MERIGIRGCLLMGRFLMGCGYFTSATTEFALTQIICFWATEPTT